MATATYVPLATQTLGSSANSITFSSIPSGYTDLRIVLVTNGISSLPGATMCIQFNSDTAGNYSYTTLLGDGSSATAASATNQSQILLAYNSGSTSTPMAAFYDIFSYANTSVNKTLLGNFASDANGNGNTLAAVGLWRSTAAITSATLFLGSSRTFNTGTRATLWGI